MKTMIGKKDLHHGKQLHVIGTYTMLFFSFKCYNGSFTKCRQSNKASAAATSYPADVDDWEDGSANWEAQILSYVSIKNKYL